MTSVFAYFPKMTWAGMRSTPYTRKEKRGVFLLGTAYDGEGALYVVLFPLGNQRTNDKPRQVHFRRRGGRIVVARFPHQFPFQKESGRKTPCLCRYLRVNVVYPRPYQVQPHTLRWLDYPRLFRTYFNLRVRLRRSGRVFGGFGSRTS